MVPSSRGFALSEYRADYINIFRLSLSIPLEGLELDQNPIRILCDHFFGRIAPPTYLRAPTNFIIIRYLE